MEESFLFISGGTALNSFVSKLKRHVHNITYVLPVSDDGGSTSEIVRVFGGPGIGDIRSRLVRLAENSPITSLLHHRLKPTRSEALQEWQAILSSSYTCPSPLSPTSTVYSSSRKLPTHPIWSGIDEPYLRIVESFLLYFDQELLSRASFDLSNGSVGNYFFTGARLFLGSLEAAIFLFSRVTNIHPLTRVFPCLRPSSFEERCSIGAQLRDGSFLYGQNNISHPPASLHSTHVNKNNSQSLHSPIDRIFYWKKPINENESPIEVEFSAHPTFVEKLRSSSVIVFSMGSLYTSIIPCLILKGVGEVLLTRKKRRSRVFQTTEGEQQAVSIVLIMNGSNDRETEGYKAIDYVNAIVKALNYSCQLSSKSHKMVDYPTSSFLTDLILMKNGDVPINECEIDEIEGLGIQVSMAERSIEGSKFVYCEESLWQQLEKITQGL
eukprot:TRINITY_DN8188_c0_g1_i1.p1 TRINITY_DN8188_c0_g1~~TRINITY_DN8188_c0_g1_i1.p1  ORF type:complete len:438 (+),score=67.09 TRINITY_DN8188_c0_g1_i1:29-1342(+)